MVPIIIFVLKSDLFEKHTSFCVGMHACVSAYIGACVCACVYIYLCGRVDVCIGERLRVCACARVVVIKPMLLPGDMNVI